MKQQKIGIIGLGIVGQTLFDWLKKEKFEVYGYDKFKNIGSLEEVNKAKIIFLCLPTPYSPKTGYDLSALEENIKYFKTPKVFIVKSTLLPGTIEYFQKKYKIHQFLHNPEFLREKYPYEDFVKPVIQLVGYTQKSKNLAEKILQLLPKASYTKIVDSKISELAKLTINDFLALKVIFANQVYDLCQKLKINYDELREILENEPRLGKTHLKVFYEGYRGFGGKCLPKDLNALIYLYKKLKINPELFQFVWKLNYKYLKNQKLIKKLQQDWLNNKS
ncbi:MAG: hypothetical protein KatS3mg094_237 [Candidatus Parcubacteria bacterium]|nr:MAG: hypothetical protein KatS3mg094_237 [Candidatus Parcubacteria bacterium]